MSDVMQWLLDLMLTDISRLLVGVLVLFSLIELLVRFKEWIS